MASPSYIDQWREFGPAWSGEVSENIYNYPLTSFDVLGLWIYGDSCCAPLDSFYLHVIVML